MQNSMRQRRKSKGKEDGLDLKTEQKSNDICIGSLWIEKSPLDGRFIPLPRYGIGAFLENS
jgi:hypothetical protein